MLAQFFIRLAAAVVAAVVGAYAGGRGTGRAGSDRISFVFALLCGVDFKIVAAGGAAAGTGRRAFVVKAFVAAVPETDETDAGGFIGIA